MTPPPATPGVLPPLPDTPVVSVVIPARDAAATLRAAVDSALTQQPPPDEVVVALGPSGDDSPGVAAELVAAHPGRLRVVDNPAGTTPAGLNVAVAASRGQVIARLDAHAQLPAGYLHRAVRVLRETGAGNVGGLQVPTADTGFGRWVAAAMRSPAGTGGAAYRGGRPAGAVDTVYLGVFRREALAAVGGFDPTFVRNQDAELNLRLTAAGYPVWLDPELAVAYRPRDSVRGLSRQYLEYGRWRRHTARVHRGSLRARQLAAPALVAGLVGSAALSVLAGTRAPAALAAGGYFAGLLAAGAHAAHDPRGIAPTAVALGTMHLSWGVGFLLGPPATVRR